MPGTFLSVLYIQGGLWLHMCIWKICCVFKVKRRYLKRKRCDRTTKVHADLFLAFYSRCTTVFAAILGEQLNCRSVVISPRVALAPRQLARNFPTISDKAEEFPKL